MHLKILNEEQTINKLKKGFSLSRYGDGEFVRVVLESRGISKLQTFDLNMKRKLIKVLMEPVKNLMIGIPRVVYKKGWIRDFHNKFTKFVSGKKIEKCTFASAFFSRPSMVNKSSDEYFDKIMSIWNNKKVVLINFNPKLVNHGIFKNCDINFIQIPRNNCFSAYNEIYEKCKELYNKNNLFLLSAGPMATCMVYDITCGGEQAIDIGQIALEYSIYKKEKNIIQWTSQNQYRCKKWK